jgi:hypothetical protein
MNAPPTTQTLSDALAIYADLPLWVAWQQEPDGKKPPFNPKSDRQAEINEPATWGTLVAAVGRAERLPKPTGLGGIGIVLAALSEHEHIGGIDLDTCRDPATGIPDDWALEIIARIKSYTEVSPSGTGYKIFFLYDPAAVAQQNETFKRGNGRHPPAIEVYLKSRYFTVTGQEFEDCGGALRLVPPKDLAWLLETYGPKFAGKAGKKAASEQGEADLDLVKAALAHLPADDRDKWIKCGHAIKHSLGEAGFEPWNDWSKTAADKYEGEAATRKRWDGFTPRSDGVTIGSVFYWAKQAGWVGPPQRQQRKPAEAGVLVEIANGAELFHTDDGVAFADIMIEGHRETWPVKSRAFRDWITREYYRRSGTGPSKQNLEKAFAVVEAKARYDAPEMAVHLRVANVGDAIFIDLCDDRWRAVEITADGWNVVDRPRVRFRRADGMLPLPDPERGGQIDELLGFLNTDRDGFILAIGWLVGALRGRGPYPVNVIYGEHGSAKSTFASLLRALVDPNKAALRGLLRHDHDLYIAANNAHVLGFDNISRLAEWLSDTLCRLATGGGFSVRALWTNTDEVLFTGSRPMLLNGIESFVERPDLADRVIILQLDGITSENRRTEDELFQAFEAARPRIIGKLYDALACGLRELANTSLNELPRMADFALWVIACETALWDEPAFERVYAENLASGRLNLLDSDIVALAIKKFAENPPRPMHSKIIKSEWTGTMTQLLGWLNNSENGYADDETRRDKKRWPQTPRALSGRLRRIAPTLREAGIPIDLGKRSGGENLVTIGTSGAAQQDDLLDGPPQ